MAQEAVTDEDGLFPDDGLRTVLPATEDLTHGEKLRRRQAARIAAGYHPLSIPPAMIHLHPDVPRGAHPDDTRGYPTCGTCQFRRPVGGHARSYPKCLVGYESRDLTPAEIDANKGTWREHATRSVTYGSRVTSGEATDVRAWWPACGSWQPRDEEDSDAQRRPVEDERPDDSDIGTDPWG